MLAHSYTLFFFLMIRRPPRSTLDRSSAASDVYKRQFIKVNRSFANLLAYTESELLNLSILDLIPAEDKPVSYTHLRAHETVLDLVCRLLLEKKKSTISNADCICYSDNPSHCYT